MNQATPSKRNRIEAVALRNLIWALMNGPHDYYELAEITGLSRSTIRRWLTPWRHQTKPIPRLVHIAEWHEDSRGYLTRPAFAFKINGMDAKPAGTPAAERKRQYRARLRQRAMLQATAGSISPEPESAF